MIRPVILFLIHVYKKTLSPQTGILRFVYFSPLITLHPGQTGCRFNQTCSSFALEQFETRPLMAATRATYARIIQCHN